MYWGYDKKRKEREERERNRKGKHKILSEGGRKTINANCFGTYDDVLHDAEVIHNAQGSTATWIDDVLVFGEV